MTDSSTFNPFEDTGDWPYRESTAPPREREGEPSPPSPGLFDREAHEPEPEPDPPFRLDDRRPEAVAELVPEPEAQPVPETEPEVVPEPEPEAHVEAPEVEVEDDLPAPEAFPEEEPHEPFATAATEPEPAPQPEPVAADQHAPGDLLIPDGPEVIEGGPSGFRRTVAIVVSRFNADITNRLLAGTIDALVDAHVAKDAITVVPVPGAFELPLAAMALAKTRRFSCVIALGCVIRGETPHFDYVAGEAASGLQLAAIETGVPVSFGLLTVENKAQAEARVGKGAEAAHAALEMADLFTQVRTRAVRSG